MITSINCRPAPWTPEIQALWNTAMFGRRTDRVTQANYYTPRPYVDQYNRGSNREGFVYTDRTDDGRRVFVWEAP